MGKYNPKPAKNPLKDFISDTAYDMLLKYGLLNENRVRNYIIQKRYKELREQKIRSGEVIEKIRQEYPYLQFDSIRKIIFERYKSEL